MARPSRSRSLALTPPNGAISLSEIISAMTFALDLTEGAIPGHGLRSCLLGMRIAEALKLPEKQRMSLYYALQLKDVGCSSNASRLTQIIGGDDREMKASTKLEDWRKSRVSLRALRVLWRNILPEAGVWTRIARFFKIAQDAGKNRKEMIETRCDRGAQILRQLEMDRGTVEAVRSIDEHWDGEGLPDGRKGRDIPIEARICSIAQHLDVFATEAGRDRAIHTLRARSGVWFDPKLVKLVVRMHTDGSLWSGYGSDTLELRSAVMGMDPGERVELTSARVDRICGAFAWVVDAKSPFTYRHSVRVAEVATAIATEMSMSSERVQLVRRAALLHDIGKLSLSNAILDKSAELTPEEWKVVVKHPTMTRSILERISEFGELAVIASEHHERMDGTGYPLGLTGAELSLESKILIIADIFVAMAENRPYRDGLAVEDVLLSLERQERTKVDADCFLALQAVVRAGVWRPEAMPARASHREQQSGALGIAID